MALQQNDKYDKLIYGKNPTENIVGIEVTDDAAELFLQTPNGNIVTEVVPNKYWLLSSYPMGDSSQRLKGDLHYKYGLRFDNRTDFLKTKKYYRNQDCYSIYDSKESLMVKDGYTYFKGLRLQDVSCLSFDIETTGIAHNDNSRVLLISNSYRVNGQVTKKLFAYDDYADEGEMIKDWCAWVREMNPSVMLGHNIMSFDIPYLEYIADRYNITLDLGRDGSALHIERAFESKFRIDGSRDQAYHKVKCYGRELIDTFFLAVKYDVGRKYESYGLKKIIEQEGMTKDDRQMYDAGQIRFNYTDPVEWIKIKDYCRDDADDALKLYDLMAPPFFYLTQSVPKSFQAMIESASGSQINSVMIRSYLQEAHSLPKTSEVNHFQGAISLGNPGIWSDVHKVDVSSLYPSIMIQYEVYDSNKDPAGNFLRLVNTFTNLRLEYKKLAKTDKYYDDLQSAFKIFINSCYGFLGAPGLMFNSPKKAEFITATGREILQTAIKWCEGKGFKLVNADTDSISYSSGSPFSEQDRSHLLNELNNLYPARIRFEDDGYYPTIIVIKAKNYILFDGKKVKIKGSALKATTKEPALKEYIKRTIDNMLDVARGGEILYNTIYMDYVREAMNVGDIKRWATRKTISEKVLSSERMNEEKVRDAIEDSEYVEGDRAYFYFKSDDSLSLIENFDGDYNKDRLLEKIYKTALVFETVIPKDTFYNFKLKRNKKLLEELCREA